MPLQLTCSQGRQLKLKYAANYDVQPDGTPTMLRNDVAEEDMENNGYALLELDDTLVAAIEQSKSLGKTPTLVIRGRPDDAAVLCTKSETYAIRRVDWSNSLLLTEYKANIEDTMEVDGGANHKDEASIQATLAHLLETRRIKPNIYRIRDVMRQARAIWDGLSPIQTTPGVSLQALHDQIQASEHELKEALLKLDCVELTRDQYRIITTEYICHVLSSIFTAFATESVILTEGSPVSPHYCFILLGLDAQALSDTMEVDVAEDQIPPSVIRHCFQRFAEPYHSGTTVEKKDNVTTQTQPDDQQLYIFSETKVCRYLGHALLCASKERRYQKDEFIQAWSNSVPDGYHVDIKMLAGLCITEEDATFNQSDNTYTLLEYVPAEQLPFEPAARIRALFEIRPRWRGEALRTYLNELAVYPEDVDGWLMKYTRRINSGGAPRRGKRKADGTGVDDVWYCARVMGGH